jgi:polyisoprenoid-binding protein YceI
MVMSSRISPEELNTLLGSDALVRVIDTLPPEYYGQGHIPGACNACVYEMVFLGTVAEITAGPDIPIVVYGSSDRSRGAAVAVEKLGRAGYLDVRELAGGLEAWQSAGYAVETAGSAVISETVVVDGTYGIDTSASRLEWTGRNLNGRHFGTIAVSGGEVRGEKGLLTGGSVTLDMNSITNLDLKDEGYNSMLISHLKSDDFFEVSRYPSAVYVIKGSELSPDSSSSSLNYLVWGGLELKGISRELKLNAEVASQPDGQLKARVSCDLDRTEWDVLYGSGKFFEKLGMHLVNEMVSIELFLTAVRQGS